MKKFAILALLAGATLVAAQSDVPSINGKWTVHAAIAGNESDTECTFSQTGSDLTGSCKAADQPASKFTGKIDGTKVTWSTSSDYNGTPLTIKYVGKLSNGKITGTMSVDPFGVEGDFTAVPAKPAAEK
jgi:hypothetical protein